jgi:hypothetical protein
VVDQPAQVLEEVRQSLHLIDDDQLVVMLAELELRLCELGAIGIDSRSR